MDNLFDLADLDETQSLNKAHDHKKDHDNDHDNNQANDQTNDTPPIPEYLQNVPDFTYEDYLTEQDPENFQPVYDNDSDYLNVLQEINSTDTIKPLYEPIYQDEHNSDYSVAKLDWVNKQNLNPEQKKAVLHTKGALLVLSGAGTGKTKVLTTRLAWLILSKQASPYEILTVTFTNKAASEMKIRASQLSNMPVDNWWLGTFHSLAGKILRANAPLVGLSSNFVILDPDDQIRLIKQILREMSLDKNDDKTITPRVINDQIQAYKDKGYIPKNIPENEKVILNDIDTVKVYEEYRKRLILVNAVDFGDLLLHTIEILKNNVTVAQYYQRRFKYILVDEYQDTNTAQYLWLKLLAMGHGNICCVGDDDQSIYSWRGAEVGNILRFSKEYPESSTIKLEQNYRSTGHILAAASAVIDNNEERLGKKLWTEDISGEKVLVKGNYDGNGEAKWISSEILKLKHMNKNTNLAEIGILVRTGSQTRAIEEQLLHGQVPYKIVGGVRFYERQEIRDAIAYLRVINNPADSLALERIINVPKRGIGTTSVNKIRVKSVENAMPLLQTMKNMIKDRSFKGKLLDKMQNICQLFDHWRESFDNDDLSSLARSVLEESTYIQMLKDQSQNGDLKAHGRLENINELYGALNEFATLSEFLEHVSLVMENEDKNDTSPKVSLMTLHGAKGLEFDYVFLPGWEEGLFPHQRSIDSGNHEVQEERRLAYVGITRGRKKVYITYADSRQQYNTWQKNQPSRFLAELPSENIITLNGGSYSHSQSYTKRTKYKHGMILHDGRPTDQSTDSYKENTTNINDTSLRSSTIPNTTTPPTKQKPTLTGKKVRHPKFGDGTVISTNGNKLTINFNQHEQKTIMSGFVKFLD